MDTAKRYITITGSIETIGRFKTYESHSLATVYMSALVSALSEVRSLNDDEPVHEDGWVRCIRIALKQRNLDIGGPDSTSGKDSLFFAAQQLFEYPFASFFGTQANNDEGG